MFRIPLLIAVALAVAFGLGILTSVWAMRATVGFGAIALGPWVAFPQAQTAGADPYAKAHRARDGKLLFGSAEGLAFTAVSDSEGRTLSAACSYSIAGITPPARFWTLHAAGPDGMPLAPPPGRPASVNSWSVLRGSDSNFDIRISAGAQAGNWLAIPGTARSFHLVLTLLDTPTAGSSGVVDLAMPIVTRTGCADA
ncbi:MAG: DUF1214 domain-containing protein [Shinella sp.]|nr:DUF1214 domain-containing protein [Shinella sp.]